MNKRPGQIVVTTEVSYCSFCGRPRNIRREEHQLGNFVRTVVTCETCHRTLSSTMGVANAETPERDPAPDNAAPAAKKPARPAEAKRTAATRAKLPSPKPKATKARTSKTK
jgi:hypothetical protein